MRHINSFEVAGEIVAATDDTSTGDRDERDGLRFAGLESHGRAGGDVETHAVRRVPVEHESRVRLDEVVMTADLDRPVAAVRDRQPRDVASLVDDDFAGRAEDLARFVRPAGAGRDTSRCDCHGCSVRLAPDGHRQKASVQRQLQIAALGNDGVVDCHELGAVGERAFDLHFVHQFGHAVHDLVASEQLPAQIHQLGDAAAVADEFEDLGGDQGDSLRVIQPQPAGEPFLCEKPGLMKCQFVEFVRSEVHIFALAAVAFTNVRLKPDATYVQLKPDAAYVLLKPAAAYVPPEAGRYHLQLQGSSPRSDGTKFRNRRSTPPTCSTDIPATRRSAPSSPRARGAADINTSASRARGAVPISPASRAAAAQTAGPVTTTVATQLNRLIRPATLPSPGMSETASCRSRAPERRTNIRLV